MSRVVALYRYRAIYCSTAVIIVKGKRRETKLSLAEDRRFSASPLSTLSPTHTPQKGAGFGCALLMHHPSEHTSNNR
jgi:hypothetical protein